jgi:hypothetical protein
MSNLARTALNLACMRYKPVFKQSEMELVKLTQSWENRTSTSMKTPMLQGSEEIEGLLFAKERFDRVCRRLEFTTGHELFDNFEQILSDSAEQYWENIVDAIGNVARTVARFDQCYKALVLRYSHEHARDHMVDYLVGSTEVLKSHDTGARHYVERVQTLIRRTNQLPGTVREIDDNNSKKIFFNSFPPKWRKTFIRSGRVYETAQISDIIQFMSNEKLFADKEEARRKTDRPSGRDFKRGRGNGGRYTSYSPQYNMNRGGYNNNFGGGYQNYGRFGRGNNYQGRGYQGRGYQGRSFGGRGFTGGRGNFGRRENFGNRGYGGRFQAAGGMQQNIYGG